MRHVVFCGRFARAVRMIIERRRKMVGKQLKATGAWCVALSAAMVVFASSAWAESEVVDGVTWYYSVRANEASIISGDVK